MKFCSECHNMYYLKVSDVDDEISNTLIYYCRNCGHEDSNIDEESICVSDMQLKRSEQNFTHIVNDYTKYDPTLPRINSIKCPNQDCDSNTMNGGGSGSASGSSKKKSLKKHVDSANKSAADAMASAADTEKILKEIEDEEKVIEEEEKKNSSLADNQIMDHNSTKASREVLYIRYDDVNMKYVYVCVHCNTTWKTDNS